MSVDSFILASASPRRRELLAGAGVAFDVCASDVPETWRPGEPAESFALRVAAEKAEAIAAQRPGALILAADTVVVLGGEILGKPRDATDAIRMLRSLSGLTHEVITGVKLHAPAGGERFAVRTAVRFRTLRDEELEWYAATGEPLDKAGAYAIQGRGGAFVEAIFGSYSNVVGLPLAETLAALRRAGVRPAWEQASAAEGEASERPLGREPNKDVSRAPARLSSSRPPVLGPDGGHTIIAARLEGIRRRVAAATERSGRAPGEVRLIAVSKTRPPEEIREAHEAGQRDFGENYAQELRDKMAALADLADLRWHAIGHLQSNKAKYVAGKALVHTLDRAELARELVKRGASDCLIEVNVGAEPQKSGVLPNDLPALLAELREIPGLQVRGLMCIPPAGEDPRPHYRRLRELRDAHVPGGELSMGMSDDFEVAIEEGATLVRVGTAIFGERKR